MKKSNLLLLGGFLAVVLLISAIHITLYAKYKAGDFTVYNEKEGLTAQPMQSFPNILFVTVRNVPGATVKFGDVAEVAKDEDENIQYVRNGDTLLITGKENANEFDSRERPIFTLPSNVTISVFNSFVSFETSKKQGENNPVIYLNKSEALFSGKKTPLQFEHVKLFVSDSSTAVFQGNNQVNNLEVQLSNSSLEYREGNFGQMSIATDSVSRLSLQSKHLLKANIKNIAQE